MKNFNRFKVLSIVAVMAFLFAARSWTLVHAAALVDGSKAETRSADATLAAGKVESTKIDNSVDRNKPALEMHESKEPKASGPEAASIDKRASERGETTASFDDHKSNSNDSKDSPSHDTGKDKSSGDSSKDTSAHNDTGDHGGSGSADPKSH